MLALLFALASHSLATEKFSIPPHDYRYVPAHIDRWPATLACDAQVLSSGLITAEVVTKEGLGDFVHGQSPPFLIRFENRNKLSFEQPVPGRGDYEILLINEGDAPADIAFDATVEFAREPDVAKYVSPPRRLLVISLSLLVFLVSLAWSGLQLMGAMRNPDSHPETSSPSEDG